MGRAEENSEAIAPIIRAVQSPYIIGSVQSKEFELSLLCDISKSLAVIADKMTEEKVTSNICKNCRHCVFPDGDGACYECTEFYDCQFESKEESEEKEDADSY